MAPSRPYWKGYLKLSLVSCPIAVYSAATSTDRVAFKQINKNTGHRLKQQMVDEETGDVVEAADKGRGFEIAKNTYVAVEDEEIEAIAIASNHTIDIDTFVPRIQIDERFLDSPYYLVPDDRVGQDAFAVIREAMRGKGMVAIGRVVLAKRERVMMLQPWDKGLLGVTLRFAYEVRDASLYFGDLPDIAIPPEMLKLAEHILDSKAADFDPSQFKDRYEEAMVAMLRSKQAGAPAREIEPVANENPNVINLMEALKRSLGSEPKASPAPKPKKPRKKAAGQSEMLLPISGKAPPKEAAQKQPAAKSRTARKAG
jgi:DNA end-binding protein Ku